MSNESYPNRNIVVIGGAVTNREPLLDNVGEAATSMGLGDTFDVLTLPNAMQIGPGWAKENIDEGTLVVVHSAGHVALKKILVSQREHDRSMPGAIWSFNGPEAKQQRGYLRSFPGVPQLELVAGAGRRVIGHLRDALHTDGEERKEHFTVLRQTLIESGRDIPGNYGSMFTLPSFSTLAMLERATTEGTSEVGRERDIHDPFFPVYEGEHERGNASNIPTILTNTARHDAILLEPEERLTIMRNALRPIG